MDESAAQNVSKNADDFCNNRREETGAAAAAIGAAPAATAAGIGAEKG